MPYTINLTSGAREDLQALRKTDQVRIIDHCRLHLGAHPTQESKARIKRLRGEVFPPYRLRVEDYRVFYGVDEATQTVTIYGIVPKDRADEWLSAATETHQDEGSDSAGTGA
jgi:mRNA-degrading endonuclease RelE of RelBE toxin-antitoxin system